MENKEELQGPVFSDNVEAFEAYGDETHDGNNHFSPSTPGPTEHFSNMNVDLDSVLKAVFFGAIFYLLSQPELYKMTKKVCGKVDGVLCHAVVYALLYLLLNMFI